MSETHTPEAEEPAAEAVAEADDMQHAGEDDEPAPEAEEEEEEAEAEEADEA